MNNQSAKLKYVIVEVDPEIKIQIHRHNDQQLTKAEELTKELAEELAEE